MNIAAVPEWWSIVNTALGLLIALLVLMLRRDMRRFDQLLIDFGKHREEFAAVKTEIMSHNVLDDRRFADHESWLSRLDARINSVPMRGAQ